MPGVMTLAHRQAYVDVIALYEEALSTLGSRKERERRAAMPPPAGPPIRKVVQLELAGTYTAFAQQLRRSEQAEPSINGNGKQPPAVIPGREGAAADEYVLDAQLVPDLLRKALDIYGSSNAPVRAAARHSAWCDARSRRVGLMSLRAQNLEPKLATVHRELGAFYVSELEVAAAACTGAAVELAAEELSVWRRWGRTRFQRATGHLEKAFALCFAPAMAAAAPGRFGAAVCLDMGAAHRRMAELALTGTADDRRQALQVALRAELRMVSPAALRQLPDCVADTAIWAATLEAVRDTMKELVAVLTRAAPSVADSELEELARYKLLYRESLLAADETAFDFLSRAAAAIDSEYHK
jgi:hypothetical protein